VTLLFVVAGGALGAPLRYLTDRAIQTRRDALFPWGTLTVNVVGSFILGALTAVVAGHAVGGDVAALVGPGFCGALTTYSTLSYETIRLTEERLGRYAALNVLLSLMAGLVAAFAGWELGSLFWR
jgi:CrcB protein